MTGDTITPDIISQFIQDMIPVPTKENPILFWSCGHCFKNDGESLYIQTDYETDQYRKINMEEFNNLTSAQK